MAVILSFVAALVTVVHVESARVGNQANKVVANPTPGLLVFNLLGGAVVWQLLIVPSSFVRSREILLTPGEKGRGLGSTADGLAVPVGVLIGYVVPSVVMLTTNTPVAIFVWLFFPVYVAAVRQATRWALQTTRAQMREMLYLEGSKIWAAVVYAIPVALSVASHVLVLWHLFGQKDDRKEMTRVTMKFIEIDFGFIAATVLYWILVEGGWRVALVTVGVSVVLGPGAGICAGWMLREGQFSADDGDGDEGYSSAGEGTQAGEETPLLH